MGKSNRIRAERFEKKNAAPVKVQKKKDRSGLVLSLVAILITVAVVLTIAGSMISSSGIIMRHRTAISSENFTISGNMMSYFYYTQYNSFLEDYSDYLSYFSLDTSKSLKAQTYGDPSLGGYETSYLGEFTGTWFDYFMSKAETQAKQILVFCEEANARGITLDDTDRENMETELETLELEATVENYTLSEYITANYGKGVKVKDIKKVLELTVLATKGVTAVQEELLAGISDEDIIKTYEEDKDSYDLVDYVYFTFTATYDGVAKLELGSDYTAAELEEKKAEVDAAYQEKLDGIKKAVEELSAITEYDAFVDYVMNYAANNHYNDAYEALKLEDEDLPSDEVVAKVKEQLVKNVVTEVLEGKTSTSGDSVLENDAPLPTLYGEEVSTNYASAIDSLKSTVFSKLSTNYSTYVIDGANYVEGNDFLEWAFEDSRTANELKKVIDNEDETKEYEATIYLLKSTRYKDETPTRNFSYMVFSDELSAQETIDKLKEGSLTKERFAEIAEEVGLTVSDMEEYSKGAIGVDVFDAWAYSDDIKVGDFTETAISVDENNYVVAYYYGEGDLTWRVTVKSNIFSERYEVKYTEMTAAYATVSNEKVLNKVGN